MVDLFLEPYYIDITVQELNDRNIILKAQTNKSHSNWLFTMDPSLPVMPTLIFNNMYQN